MHETVQKFLTQRSVVASLKQQIHIVKGNFISADFGSEQPSSLQHFSEYIFHKKLSLDNRMIVGSLLYIYGCSAFLCGIATGIWSFYALAVTFSLFVRVPPPLGQLPPLLDATFSAFVSTFLWPGVLFVFLLALKTSSLVWLSVGFLLVYRGWLSSKEQKQLKQVIRTIMLQDRPDERPSSSEVRVCSSELRGSYHDHDRHLPFLVRMHPYFLSAYRDGVIGGGGVRVHRISPEEAASSGFPFLNTSIDVWMLDQEIGTSPTRKDDGEATNSDLQDGTSTSSTKPTVKRPVFFFVHGGAWRAGSSRRHTQVALLHRLVREGWVVVAVNYRKIKWPQQVDDSLSAFHYMVHAAQSWVRPSSGVEIDLDRIVLSGVSAGGHLVALLTTRIMDDIELNKRCKVVGSVLFYPAVDPSDEAAPRSGARFLFSIPFLRARKGQGLMHWFFERAVLEDSQDDWHSAKPIHELHLNPQRAVNWPPCMCIHGDLDSIVPIEQSQAFLRTLYNFSKQQHHQQQQYQQQRERSENAEDGAAQSANSISDAVCADRNCITGADARQQLPVRTAQSMCTHRSCSSEMGSEGDSLLSSTGRSLPQNYSANSLECDASATLSYSAVAEHGIEGLQVAVDENDLNGPYRPGDILFTVPGAKHSFEAGGGEITRIVFEGVATWLRQFNRL
jgi:acetyl esterase/lipase